MKAIRRWVSRLVGQFRSRNRERELAREIEGNLQLHIEDAIRSGATPAEARRQALIAFGSVAATREAYHDAASFPLLRDLARDLQLAVRLARKTLLVSATIVLTVAVAIAANAVVITTVSAAAFQPLSVPEGDRLVQISVRVEGASARNVHGAASLLSLEEFTTVRDEATSVDGVLAFAPFNEATLGGETPRPMLITLASCEYFSVLRVPAALGRTFEGADCAAGAAPTAVISDRLWRSAFHADAGVVGREISVNRSPFRVVGVTPPWFTGTQVVPEDAFLPLNAQQLVVRGRSMLQDANTSWLYVFGRRRPGERVGAVQTNLDVIAARLTASRANGSRYVLTASPATLSALPEIRTFVLAAGAIVSVAVGLVLLIACANIANILLSRATTRRREISLRLALGAGRSRIVRQLMTESLLLAGVGGVLGYIAAGFCSTLLIKVVLDHLPPGTWPIVFTPQADWRVMGATALLTTSTGIAFGLAPALQATRAGVLEVREGTATERRSVRRLRQAFVGTQVGVSALLLVCAALLARGLHRANTLDPGLALDRVSVATVDLTGAGYSPSGATAFLRAAETRLRQLPGVREVALTSATPLSDQHTQTRFMDPDTHVDRLLEFSNVSPEYFSALGLAVVRGRAFTEDEIASGRAMMVTESTARRLWPGTDPLTRTLLLDGIPRPVVGVVRDAQLSRLGRSDSLFVFLPSDPPSQPRLRMLIASDSAAPLARPIREAIRSIDPELAVTVTPLSDNLEQWRAPSRLVSAGGGLLALVSIALATMGVFGTVAYGVARRTREIGIRVALGADPGDVLRLMVRQGLAPVLAGLALGVAAAALVSGVLAAMLFGGSAHDPLAFGSVAVLLLAVAAGASWIPARRALRVEPSVALRDA